MDERVLVVEDDTDIIEILSLYLGGSGYQVTTANDGAEGLEALRREDISIALVDIMMPNMNGFDFIKEARTFTDIPIIILSARNQPSDKIMGLDLGADGYITKPFDAMEVIAYIRAELRRYQQKFPGVSESHGSDTMDSDQTIHAGDFEIDVKELMLRKRDEAIPLTASELKIMMKLLSSPGRVFTKAQLYECINGEGYSSGEESVMVHISNIRSKIEDDPGNPTAIITVRGLGYKFEG